VANALSPAQVVKVEIDETNRIAAVTVPERMLSLAIGREGQNARLAAKLTGWRIDIRSDQAPARAPETPAAPAAAVALDEGESIPTAADEHPADGAGQAKEAQGGDETPSASDEIEPAPAPKKRAAPKKAAAAVADPKVASPAVAAPENGVAPAQEDKASAKPRTKKAAPVAVASEPAADAEPVVAAAPARRSRKAATAVAEEGE